LKVPRDLSGAALAKALSRVGYGVTRQTGSHVRLTTQSPTQHHVTVPAPKVIAQEMIEDLEAALEQLRSIAADLGSKPAA
jgi:predicted RNA binding protein YcfA (HicA-like mRNA interferase family)